MRAARGRSGAIGDPDERAEMLEGFGLGEGALFRMVRSAYHLRAAHVPHHGDKARAWTFFEGSTAPVVPGGSTPTSSGLHPRRGDPLGRAARHRLVDQGQRARQDPPEGKDYVADDGDVMEFRFSISSRFVDRFDRVQQATFAALTV